MDSSAASSSYSKKKKKGSGGARLSTDPQSVAARERRHRISERFKILQSLVPGGSKLDTVSMLEEAIQYVKFLKAQIWLHQAMINGLVDDDDDRGPSSLANHGSSSVHHHHHHNNNSTQSSGDQEVGRDADVEFGLPVYWVSGEGNN